MPNCKPNQIINPATGRCVLKTGAIGKKLLGINSPPKVKKEKSPAKKREKSPPKAKKVKSPPKVKTEDSEKYYPFQIPSGYVDEHTKRTVEIMKHYLRYPVDKRQAYIERKKFIESLQTKYKHVFDDIESLAKLRIYSQDIIDIYKQHPLQYETVEIARAIIDIMKDVRNHYDTLLFEGNLKKTENETTFFYDVKNLRFGGNGLMSFLYYHTVTSKSPTQLYNLSDMFIINKNYILISSDVKYLHQTFKNKTILNDTLDVFGSFISYIVLIMEHEIAHQLDLQMDTVDNKIMEKVSKKNGSGHTKRFWNIYAAYTGHDVHLNFSIFYGLKNLYKEDMIQILKKSDSLISEDYIEEFVNTAIEKLLIAKNS